LRRPLPHFSHSPDVLTQTTRTFWVALSEPEATKRARTVPSVQEFQEIDSHPTFKKPLKPPLLLFELFVQSEPARCSWALAHAWLDWPQCCLLASSGLASHPRRCPLLEVKRTSIGHCARSAYDPKRKLAGPLSGANGRCAKRAAGLAARRQRGMPSRETQGGPADASFDLSQGSRSNCLL